MNIFVRYAKETNDLPNNFITKAYDDRFLFILSGEGKIIFSNRSEQISKNTLCYYPAGESYQIVSSKENPLHFITINFDFYRDFDYIKKPFSPLSESMFEIEKILYPALESREKTFKKSFVFSNFSNYRFMFTELAEAFRSRTRYGREIADGILQTICYKILDSQEHTYNELYIKIINYINNNYKTIQINKDISKTLCYHEYYLNKVFKKYSGKTIHEYITEVRLKKAANLLMYSQIPISDIALNVGFNNFNHFSTKFKKFFSVTPTNYRKMNHSVSHIKLI